MLPLEIVYHIRDFLPWRHKAIMVSKEWLQTVLKRTAILNKWRSKRLMYSFLNVFGHKFVHRKWSSFCCLQLSLVKRVRNHNNCLSWKATAEKYFNVCRCEACGVKTFSFVFEIYLCSKCRFNKKLVNCYMVKVYQAKEMGVSKRILDRVPYHQGSGCRLRFWKDIVNAIESDS
jgi:hypothetical protein